MIVRFGKARYDMKGKASGKRKPTIWSEKSRDSRMKGGGKVMISFKGRKTSQSRKGKGKKKGKEGDCDC